MWTLAPGFEWAALSGMRRHFGPEPVDPSTRRRQSLNTKKEELETETGKEKKEKGAG